MRFSKQHNDRNKMLGEVAKMLTTSKSETGDGLGLENKSMGEAGRVLDNAAPDRPVHHVDDDSFNDWVDSQVEATNTRNTENDDTVAKPDDDQWTSA